MQNEENTKTVDELEILESKLASASDAITEAQHVISEVRLKRDQPELPMTPPEPSPVPKFQIGDKVRCVKESLTLKVGQIHSVLVYNESKDGIYVKDHPGRCYCLSYFEKVEEEEEQSQTVAGIDEEKVEPTYEELLEREDVKKMLEKELSCPINRAIAVEWFDNDKERMVRSFVAYTDNQSVSKCI